MISLESGMPTMLMEPLKPSGEKKLQMVSAVFCFCLQENYLLTFLLTFLAQKCDPESIDSVKQERRARANRERLFSSLLSRPLNLSQVTDSSLWPGHSRNSGCFPSELGLEFAGQISQLRAETIWSIYCQNICEKTFLATLWVQSDSRLVTKVAN